MSNLKEVKKAMMFDWLTEIDVQIEKIKATIVPLVKERRRLAKAIEELEKNGLQS